MFFDPDLVEESTLIKKFRDLTQEIGQSFAFLNYRLQFHLMFDCELHLLINTKVVFVDFSICEVEN